MGSWGGRQATLDEPLFHVTIGRSMLGILMAQLVISLFEPVLDVY